MHIMLYAGDEGGQVGPNGVQDGGERLGLHSLLVSFSPSFLFSFPRLVYRFSGKSSDPPPK